MDFSFGRCIIGCNNDFNSPVENKTFSDPILNPFRVPGNVWVTRILGLILLVLILIVYIQSMYMKKKAPPSFFPLVNICLCALFFGTFPTLKFFVNRGIIAMGASKVAFKIYVFCYRAFIVLLPLNLLQILLEILYRKMRSNKFLIVANIWSMVFLYALPALLFDFGDENEQIYEETYNSFLLRFTHIGLGFILVMYLVAGCRFFKTDFVDYLGIEPRLLGVIIRVWICHSIFLNFIFFSLFWMIPVLFVPEAGLLEAGGFEFETLYFFLLIVQPGLFIIARMYFGKEVEIKEPMSPFKWFIESSVGLHRIPLEIGRNVEHTV